MFDKTTTIENYLYHVNKIKEESTDSQIVGYALALFECATKVYSSEASIISLVELGNIDLDENEYQDARALNHIKRRLIELLAVGIEVVNV